MGSTKLLANSELLLVLVLGPRSYVVSPFVLFTCCAQNHRLNELMKRIAYLNSSIASHGSGARLVLGF